MKDLGEQVRILALSHEEIKDFIGGIPHTSELSREIQNTQRFLKGNIPERQRIRLGFYLRNQSKQVIGYHSITLLNSANPTQYERENIGLENPLTYVQGKLIFVHPSYWGTKVSRRLLEQGLHLSQKQSTDWVADLMQTNKRALKFLAKHGIFPEFEWTTPNQTKMWRVKKCQ